MIKDLDIILSEGESYTIEFKESADKTLPSEVCAFANASGGRIFSFSKKTIWKILWK